MRGFFVWLLVLPIRGYRLILSPWIGHSCRFQPSCSVYAIEALETMGPSVDLGLRFIASHAAIHGVGRVLIPCRLLTNHT